MNVNELIEALSKVFDLTLGKGAYPPSLTGDLADFIDTVEITANRLRALASQPDHVQTELVRNELFRLRVELQQDLPMLAADILPAIDEILGPSEE